jgi:hypothetical protein
MPVNYLTMPGQRLRYAIATLIVIALGLSTRPLKPTFPATMDALGDALWSAMVYLAISTLFPTVRRSRRVTFALTFSYLIELSQLHHSPWIDHLRSTTLGHLALGSDFDPVDLLWYTLGVVSAAALNRAAVR